MIYLPEAREILNAVRPEVTPIEYENMELGAVLLGATAILESDEADRFFPIIAQDSRKRLLLAATDGAAYGTAALSEIPEEVHNYAVDAFTALTGLSRGSEDQDLAIGIVRSAINYGLEWRTSAEQDLERPFPLDLEGIQTAVDFIFGQTEGEA